MVRLKDVLANIDFSPILLFQFLMVRLKVLSFFSLLLRISISIPYGAIKRIAARTAAPIAAAISIPYGAIKRTTAPTKKL